LELANAMIYSSFTGDTVELPLNAGKYERFLAGLQKEFTLVQKELASS
jgi:hypothetical protein